MFHIARFRICSILYVLTVLGLGAYYQGWLW